MSKLSNLVREMSAKSRKFKDSLINNRTAISKDELIKQYPQGIHINKVEFDPFDDTDDFVCTYAEDDGRFFYSTMVLTKKFNTLLESYDDIKELSRDFAEEPVLTKITKRLSNQTKRYYFDYQFVTSDKDDSFAKVEDDGDVLPPF